MKKLKKGSTKDSPSFYKKQSRKNSIKILNKLIIQRYGEKYAIKQIRMNEAVGIQLPTPHNVGYWYK